MHPDEKPLAFLHSVLERENAQTFTDEYLTIPMRADHAIWILTANSTEGLAPSIVDRLTAFEIADPDANALKTVISSIYAETNQRFNQAFNPELGPEFWKNCVVTIRA